MNCWRSFVDLVLTKGLEGLDLQHLQCLAVNMIDDAYLQSESDIPSKRCCL